MVKEQPIQPDTVAQSRRRTLLNWLWGSLGLLAVLELGWLTGLILKARKKRTSEQIQGHLIDGGRVESLRPGEVKALPEGMLFLACLDDNRFIALSRTCTHLGCALSWEVNEQKFICPCHGSTFDRRGVVLTSPAIRPLDFYPIRIENGQLRIDVSLPQRRESFNLSQTTRV